jgi:hypothetical protein
MTDAIYYLFNAQLALKHLKAVAVKVVKTPFICHLNVKKNYARACDLGNIYLIKAKDSDLDLMNQRIRLQT